MQHSARALVFDFDGTILDTETPIYESWADAFRFAGVEPIPLQTWLQSIGKADGDALDLRAILCEQLGIESVPQEVEDHRRELNLGMLAEQSVRSGVLDWIHASVGRNVPLAVASSSPSDWVHSHLANHGLAKFFPVVSCADPGIPGKPNPTVYLTACRELDVSPEHALAIEDSSTGVSAAIAAGMSCIAAPGPMTQTLNFEHATVRVDSLTELDPADWLI